MNRCQEYQKMAHLYVDNELKNVEKVQFEKHIEYCEVCKNRYAEIVSLKTLISNFIEQAPLVDISKEVCERISEKNIAEKERSKLRLSKGFKIVLATGAMVVIASVSVLINPFEISFFNTVKEEEIGKNNDENFDKGSNRSELLIKKVEMQENENFDDSEVNDLTDRSEDNIEDESEEKDEDEDKTDGESEDSENYEDLNTLEPEDNTQIQQPIPQPTPQTEDYTPEPEEPPEETSKEDAFNSFIIDHEGNRAMVKIRALEASNFSENRFRTYITIYSMEPRRLLNFLDDFSTEFRISYQNTETQTSNLEEPFTVMYYDIRAANYNRLIRRLKRMEIPNPTDFENATAGDDINLTIQIYYRETI